MHTRLARLARGWLVGGFATLVAALSHTLGGGDAPSLLAVGVGLWFGGTLGTLLVSPRRASLPRVALVVGASQFAFHLFFSLLGTGGSVAVTGSHHAQSVTFAGGGAHVHTDPAMWVAHALAAVATTAFLARAEAALWALLATAVRRLAVALRPAAPLPVRRAPRPPRPRLGVAALRPLLLAAAAPRRGPPSRAFA